MGSVGQRAAKLLAFKVGDLKKKVYHRALALVEPVGPGLTPTWSESFSKFDGQQLCSPLTYRSYISCRKLESSKTSLNVY